MSEKTAEIGKMLGKIVKNEKIGQRNPLELRMCQANQLKLRK